MIRIVLCSKCGFVGSVDGYEPENAPNCPDCGFRLMDSGYSKAIWDTLDVNQKQRIVQNITVDNLVFAPSYNPSSPITFDTKTTEKKHNIGMLFLGLLVGLVLGFCAFLYFKKGAAKTVSNDLLEFSQKDEEEQEQKENYIIGNSTEGDDKSQKTEEVLLPSEEIQTEDKELSIKPKKEITFPAYSVSKGEYRFLTGGEATGSFTSPKRCGAYLDETGCVWLWNDDTMVAKKTHLLNTKAIFVRPARRQRIYYINNEGAIYAAYLEFSDDVYVKETKQYKGFKNIVQFDIDDEGETIFAIDTDGILWGLGENRSHVFDSVEEMKEDEPVRLFEDFASISRIFIYEYDNEISVILKTEDFNYYCLGKNIFGELTSNPNQYIIEPAKINLASGAMDARFVKTMDKYIVLCCLGSDGVLSGYDTYGNMDFSFENIRAMYGYGYALSFTDSNNKMYGVGTFNGYRKISASDVGTSPTIMEDVCAEGDILAATYSDCGSAYILSNGKIMMFKRIDNDVAIIKTGYVMGSNNESFSCKDLKETN